MESSFRTHASGGNSGESLFVRFGEERVDSVDGQGGFEAIGSLHVPGCEDELTEKGSFHGRGWAEFIFVSRGEGFEFRAIFGGEQDGLACVGGTGFPLGGCGIGFDLRDVGHDGFFSFEIDEGG